MLCSKLWFQHFLFLLLNTVIALPQTHNEDAAIASTINGHDARIASDVVKQPQPFASPEPPNEEFSRPGSSSSHLLQARDQPGMPDQQAAFALHNEERKSKSLPPLEWDYSLASAALIYAQTAAMTDTYVFSDESSRPGQVENIAWASGFEDDPCKVAAQMWVDLRDSYHGEVIPQGNYSTKNGYRPYAKLMWSETKKMGIAAAPALNGKWYIVARYSPMGKMDGKKLF